jgi:transposase
VKRERPPEDELRRLYLDEETSMGQIAVQYGVTTSTIRRWLVLAEIPLRSSRRPQLSRKLEPLDREVLERMYVRQQRSATDIATALGVGLGRVKASLEHYEIPFEQRTSRTFLPPDMVKGMYMDRHWSIQRIANYFGVNHDRVSKLLDELGVKKPKPDRPLPRRKVERFEEVTVALTFTGKPVTRMVAWLECGHKSPIRNQNLSRLPVDATFSCVPCAKKESGS